MAQPAFSKNGREVLRPHGTPGQPFSNQVPHHARSSSVSEQFVAKGCVRAWQALQTMALAGSYSWGSRKVMDAS